MISPLTLSYDVFLKLIVIVLNPFLKLFPSLHLIKQPNDFIMLFPKVAINNLIKFLQTPQLIDMLPKYIIFLFDPFSCVVLRVFFFFFANNGSFFFNLVGYYLISFLYEFFHGSIWFILLKTFDNDGLWVNIHIRRTTRFIQQSILQATPCESTKTLERIDFILRYKLTRIIRDLFVMCSALFHRHIPTLSSGRSFLGLLLPFRGSYGSSFNFHLLSFHYKDIFIRVKHIFRKGLEIFHVKRIVSLEVQIFIFNQSFLG